MIFPILICRKVFQILLDCFLIILNDSAFSLCISQNHLCLWLRSSLAKVKIYDTVNAIAKIRYKYQQMPRPLENNGCKQEYVKSYPSNSKGVIEEINR